MSPYREPPKNMPTADEIKANEDRVESAMQSLGGALRSIVEGIFAAAAAKAAEQLPPTRDSLSVDELEEFLAHLLTARDHGLRAIVTRSAYRQQVDVHIFYRGKLIVRDKIDEQLLEDARNPGAIFAERIFDLVDLAAHRAAMRRTLGRTMP